MSRKVQEVVGEMLDKQRLRTFVLGGIAGALAGILFAPKSGKELRGSIASHAGEARERSRETYFEAQERVQERIAEAREHSPRRGEIRSEEARDPLAKLGPVTPEPALDPEPPVEIPTRSPPNAPPLRDVSRGSPPPAVGEDPDEIRRRIQETRSRLRQARLGTPEPEDAPGNRDG